MADETTRFDAADYLDSPEAIAAYMEAAFDEAEGPGDIAKALGTVARATGKMPELAEKTGVTREALYKALSDKGNPTLATLWGVSRALGLRLSVTSEKAVA